MIYTHQKHPLEKSNSKPVKFHTYSGVLVDLYSETTAFPVSVLSNFTETDNFSPGHYHHHHYYYYYYHYYKKKSNRLLLSEAHYRGKWTDVSVGVVVVLCVCFCFLLLMLFFERRQENATNQTHP